MKLNQFITKSASTLVLALSIATLRAETTQESKTEKGTNATPALVTVKTLLEDPAKYVDSTVVLEGFVTQVCQNRGCWAILHDEDPDDKGQIRVKQDESKPFKPFLNEHQGKTVLVTGEVHETKIDVDYLDKWEARVKAAKEKAAKKSKEEPAKTEVTGEKKDAYTSVFKQIESLRKRVADSKKGYVTSISFEVSKWEPKTLKP